jgi:putative flippase GtrA
MIISATRSFFQRLHMASRDRATVVKATSFALIGLLNTVLDFGIFSAGYYLLGLPIIAANVLSWTIAVSSSYVLNSMITFSVESRRELSGRTYATFVLAQLAGFFANTATILVASHFMPVLFGKVLATGASFMVNFSLSHFFVFRGPATDTLQD